jgi:segregation and condensation protein B
MGFVKLRGRRRSPGRPVTYGTTDAFLEHFGLGGLIDLPGVAEMKAAGLLDMTAPIGFEVPEPALATGEDEIPLGHEEESDTPEFHQDFMED